MMTVIQKRETAKIYPFPMKNGANVGMPSKEAKWAAEIAAMGATQAVIGSSWYHDEAVKADARPERR